MYELKLYYGEGLHWAYVSEETLEEFRKNVDDAVNPSFIEIYCESEKSFVGINREKLELYEYKRVEGSE